MKRFFRALGKGFIKYQYHIVCTVITLMLLLLWVFCFPNALGRFVESFRDLGLSVAYVFCDAFDIEMKFTPSVNTLPDYSFLNVKGWVMGWFKKPYEPSYPSILIPWEWEEFTEKWKLYWKTFVDRRYFLLYLYHVVNGLYWITTVLMYAIPIFFGIRALFRKFYFREKAKKEVDENGEILQEQPIKDSKPLQSWRKFYFKVIDKVVLWFVGLFEFVRMRDALWGAWLLLVLLCFNVFAIVIDFVAYYLYFSMSFDVVSLYKQIYKLLLDLYPFIRFLPLFSWVTLVILGLRKKSEDLAFEQEYVSMLIAEEGDDA